MSTLSAWRSRQRQFKAEINVVPYIDVMLVLLVIFMVVAPLNNDLSTINLPTANKSTAPPDTYIEIVLKPGTTTLIQHNTSSQNKTNTTLVASNMDLKQKLKALQLEAPDLPLMIAADKEMKYEAVVELISLAKQLGITRVGLLTQE